MNRAYQVVEEEKKRLEKLIADCELSIESETNRLDKLKCWLKDVDRALNDHLTIYGHVKEQV
jgi:hypothetical protein